MTKLYERDGRRFVQIEDHLGMFYQEDGTFTKEKTEKSVGLCIISDFKKDVVMELEDKLYTCDETNANNIPYQVEFLAALAFRDILKLSSYKNYFCMLLGGAACGWFCFGALVSGSAYAHFGGRKLLYRKVHRIKK